MADICLIVEGAYPYVTGGVSSWVQALMSNLPHLTFSVLHIGARPDPNRKALYRMPDNVVDFQELFINNQKTVKKSRRNLSSEERQHFQDMHEIIASGKMYDVDNILPLLRKRDYLGMGIADLLYSRAGWQLLLEIYEQNAAQQSFMDFFWTFRCTYLPILKIFEAAIPQARVYHSVSTGFSGLLGALAKVRTGRPFMLTEHGLYTREREIEISQATWMGQVEQIKKGRMQKQRLSFSQEWWLNIYRFMEKISYDMADSIISITSVNQKYQLSHGADSARLKLIPNGINTRSLVNLRAQKQEACQTTNTSYKEDLKRAPKKMKLTSGIAVAEHVVVTSPLESTYLVQDAQPFLIGFVGRIVPIKDVKSFIRALKIASQTIPSFEAYFVGPTEEDVSYFQECQRLVEVLGIEAFVHFTGSADVKDYYSILDVLVLTSLSEGQPLVVLEGNCAGIPVIATDVGACRELLQGITPADRALGESGLITPVASPHETAHAIIQLWRDDEMRQRMGRAGQKRVQRFYRQELLYSTYSDLYQLMKGRDD